MSIDDVLDMKEECSVRSILARFLCVAALLAIAACGLKNDIPTEFPTPVPPPVATPVAPLVMKRDPVLEGKFAEIAKDAGGRVGAAAVVIETGEAAFLNGDDHFPMQSVYKLPISMAVMDQIRTGKMGLDEVVGVSKQDLVRPGQASPLRDKNPDGGEFTIRELIRLAIVFSDGTASDVLLRIGGGPIAVQDYLAQIGIRDMKVANTEKELGGDWQLQYENWSTPRAAAELIRYLNSSYLSEAETPDGVPENTVEMTGSALIVKYLYETVTGPKRLRGLMPKGGGNIGHKTGTSGTRDGITAATNDIGLMKLGDGRTVAIAVFVADSPADERTRESVIARIAKAAYDHWTAN